MFSLKLFKKTQFAQPVNSEFSSVLQKLPEATQVSDLDLLKKQVSDQQEIIRELVTIATWIANHKRFEHIQEKLVTIHNLLDKLQESKK